MTPNLDNLTTILEELKVEIVSIKGFKDDMDKQMKAYDQKLDEFTKFETIYKEHKAEVEDILNQKTSLEALQSTISQDKAVIETEKQLLRDKQLMLENKEKELTDKAKRLQEMFA